MSVKCKLGWLFGMLLSIAFALAILLAWPVSVPEFATVRAQFTPSEAYLLDRHGERLDTKRVDLGVRRFEWVPLDAISPALVEAIVNGEDRRFWEHSGVDWQGALGAIRDQLLHHRRRGASTITMQLAALVDNLPRPRGTLAAWQRKLHQVRVAVALEAWWSKQQILEAYLNLLGFQGELQGIGAAAEILAHKAPSGLTNAESVVLAALLPDPEAKVARVIERACAREQARHSGLACAEIEIVANQMLTHIDLALPSNRLAPQLADRLLKTPGQRVQTTLDRATQQLARDVLNQHLSTLSARNVRDGAILVVGNATGDVLAYVGSAGPQSRASEVDGVRARRQAGSTLKPFLYGLAVERRYLTAASLLDDAPINLESASGTYIPQDYDHDFKGQVSVRTALASSLNVPAVRALMLVGVEAFRNRLHELGYLGIVEDGEFYGYSLALGSAEVSLWEQAQAYRTLARGGRWSPLHVQANDNPHADTPVLPGDASFIIDDILSDRAARALTFGLDNFLNTPFWSAAKTGTSKDMRDNWCVGFSERYTVAVWVGNFEGDAMQNVSGVTGAAPVWHDVMIALHRALEPRRPTPPPGIVTSRVRYSSAAEYPRQEWFLSGTQTTDIAAVTPNNAIARITSPANGTTLALDPDIPVEKQRVLIATKGMDTEMSLLLDGRLLARASEQVLWPPHMGIHILSLQSGNGGTVDQVRFTVR